jgi:hypothetical protein
MVLDLVHWFLCVLIYLSKCKNQRKEKKKSTWLEQPRLSSVWHTGLSGGAPDSVRCARLDSGEQATLGKLWRCTAIIHRTVQWSTKLSGAPTSPELQRSAAPGMEGNRAPNMNSGCPVVHRTVRCATRQKARIAFLVGLQRLLAALGL